MCAMILVADDEPDVLRLVVLKLERAGHQLTTATTGDQALAAALDQRPDLVLLDVTMPGIGGLDVCRSLKQQLGAMAPKVVMLSARGLSDDVRGGLDSGADGYIVKPFRPSALLAEVERYLVDG
ncbi:MAG: response regulator [Chloroflexi bacterium]|nr:response regulator [Chloroflexota bacterium]